MFKVTETRWLATDVKQLQVHAPRIANKQQAGQFVIVRVNEHGERIPLTIAGSNSEAGTISLIVQGVGKTTKLINQLHCGDHLLDVVGPLGNPTRIERFGHVVVVAGGVGAAIAFPSAESLKLAGNRVTTILGARTKQRLILQEELAAVSDDLFVTTDDGTAGPAAFVTDVLTQQIHEGDPIDLVLAVGPIPMMKSVAAVTRPFGIPTTVSLNAIMVDGTGMCGGCRVIVGGEPRFACVDGPEFDAHQVDFDILANRNELYRAAEKRSLADFVASIDSDARFPNKECRLYDQVT